MHLEHAAITHALNTSPNITQAAKQLGASRRTLQNRMRHYGIPKGKSGRPREALPYARGSFAQTAVAAGVLVGIGLLVGSWMRSRKPSPSPPAVAGIALHGTDVLGAFV